MLLLVTFYFVILATYCRPFFGMVDSFPECERIYIADTVELCVCVLSQYTIYLLCSHCHVGGPMVLEYSLE